MYTLFVRPINHVSKEFLLSRFSEYGEVKDLYIPKDFKSGRRRTIAYVKYDDKVEASKAIEGLNGKEINGKEIYVSWSSEKQKTPDEMEAAKAQRQLERQENPKPPKYTPEEHELYLKKKHFAEGEFHEKYFTAVDYPLGVGEEYTPVFQRGLKPIGERKTFFTWQFIPEDKIQMIIEQEILRSKEGKKPTEEKTEQPEEPQV
ncbi:hypothetical protein TVAG_166930 [Trichomonas vaginalis G3]|uniref:RRM domain-containing protein n=1 Tax=Trichomonas vaginalis (strain ATCC PRA-98 / G3) TaxID=412133 RepID=A2DEA0_TRIV3|nr:RNA binding [Trichomonas vaginalis G3]EAY21318.1 hypothetical protein TVAG_166930 [Trichomonas vaginalis G3]KAI5548945.1 RNA binding [Trichomonas vaginalis G3]|eukprot:XP_001582304.1 hypothetical protein [Trichomonas vaginalis G3]